MMTAAHKDGTSLNITAAQNIWNDNPLLKWDHHATMQKVLKKCVTYKQDCTVFLQLPTHRFIVGL